MKRIIKNLLTTSLLAISLVFVAVPVYVSASPATDACDGIKAAGGTCGDKAAADAGFKNIITVIINVLSVIVGAVAVIMIIIGGFRYVVSGGDGNSVSGAKNTILYAIVGLVVVLFAQVIVAFVLDRATAAPSAPPAPVQSTTKPSVLARAGVR